MIEIKSVYRISDIEILSTALYKHFTDFKYFFIFYNTMKNEDNYYNKIDIIKIAHFKDEDKVLKTFKIKYNENNNYPMNYYKVAKYIIENNLWNIFSFNRKFYDYIISLIENRRKEEKEKSDRHARIWKDIKDTVDWINWFRGYGEDKEPL